MGDRVRHKGKFIKKKVLDKRMKIINTLREKKAVKNNNKPVESNLIEGPRLVDLKELGKNLKCCQCHEVLSLDNTYDETRLGLHSSLRVNCVKCNTLTPVPTGKLHSVNDNARSKHSDITTGVVLGAIHAGYGCSGLNKILACANMPRISSKLFKRYEREVGPAIEKAAQESCKKAASEERQLVLNNIEKLCEILPPEVAEKIYPHHKILASSASDMDYNNNNKQAISDSNNNNTRFDSAVGEVINIIVSYDMGWSKRGNGRSYDSLNGYGTIIGFLSGKILDYADRIRKCRYCDKGRSKEDHDCRKNFEGSAKAMEQDAGAALINESKILKESNLAVRVVIGDEDSSTMAAVRRGTVDDMFKFADGNHLKKNFGKELHKLNYKELKPKETMKHIKKCFSYAIAQNAGNVHNLASTLRNIPDHLFNSHENCGSWCNRKNGSSQQTIILSNVSLYDELSDLFNRYAANALKFSIAASSQPNEAFNNIMAHKCPKNICYSLSESSSFRLASSVCAKNDGESSILEIRKNLGLSPGQHTNFYAKQADLKRTKRSNDAKLPATKKQRISVAQEREKLKRKNEKVEGMQYQSNMGFLESIETSQDFDVSQLESTEIKITSEACNLVYFDLETSGLSKNDEILQIAASCEGRKFSIYINPTKRIDEKATVHTGLKNIKGDLYFRGKKVLSVSMKDGLESFLQFLNLSLKPCVLVAHNVSFDKSHLLRAILKYSMVQEFSKIAGFSDSLPLFKKHFGVKKVSGEFKLSTLAAEHLNITSEDQFHEAMYDVEILEQLVAVTNKDHLFINSKSYRTCLNDLANSKIIASAMQDLSSLKGVVSDHILKKIASEGIKYTDLLNKYQSEGTEKFKEFLKNPSCDKNKARVSKDKRIIDKLVKFFEEKQ